MSHAAEFSLLHLAISICQLTSDRESATVKADGTFVDAFAWQRELSFSTRQITLELALVGPQIRQDKFTTPVALALIISTFVSLTIGHGLLGLSVRLRVKPLTFNDMSIRLV